MNIIIKKEFNDHIKIANLLHKLTDDVESASMACIDCLKKDGKILIFGNGGSASDAQHIAAEIVGRYKTERMGLAAIALNTDTSLLTAISNDFGYDNVFKRQVEALANNGDVLIGISTGGSSPNVINALKIAKDLGCKSIGLSGKDGGEFNKLCDVNILVTSEDTARIQEMHIVIAHTICHLIDQAFDGT
jgi:D-sedoheptulose 7-phosphate isomerase